MLSISASRHGLYLYYLSVRKKIALGICLIALVVGASAALATAAPEDLTVTKTNSQRATGQYTTEIAAKDGYTYEPDYESGTVKITNQANPNNPTITFVDDDYLWMPDQIVRNGNVLGVMHYTENGSSMFVTTYDISNAANPVKIATLDLSTAPITCQNSSGLYPANDSVLLVVPCGGQVEVASLDISNPGSLSLADTIDLSSYSWGVNSIQSDGADSHVFFSDNTLYATLDVSDPANLAVTESVDGNVYETMGALQPGTRKVGNYVYTTTWVLGGGEYDIDLRVVDVSNPASPSTVNTLNLCNRPYRDVEMQVLTNQRIITTCDEQLFEINLSSPTAPTLSPKATTLYSYGDMYVDTNGRVYQNADFENFVPSQVYQANGPATMPSFLGANAGDTGMGYNTYFVIPDGSTTAFVFNHELPIVKTVDISDPSDMRVLSTQFLMQNGTFIPDFQFAGSSASLSLSADESHVIIVNADSDAEPSLISVDISNPASISVTDRYLLGSTEFPRANVLDGDVLYSLASNQLRSTRVEADGTFTSLDTQAVTIPAGGNYSYASLSVVNNAAIMTYGVQQARYIDISNPASLGAAQTTNLPVMGNYTYFRTPFVDGNHIYVGIQDTVYAVDASNPASLSISSSVTNADAPDYYGVFRYYDSDELLYGNGNDFAKLNYSNPANISITETTSDGGLYPDALWGFDEVWDVEIAGNYAFGASNIAEGSYYSFDISDLTNPKPLDVLNFQVPFWQPQSLHTVGNTLYVGGRTDWEVNADLSTYSLATPGAPQRTGASVHEFTDIIATASSGSYLYAARDWGGLGVYDISNPDFPVLQALLGDAGSPEDVEIIGNTLYLSDSSDGLLVYDISNPTSPNLLTTYDAPEFSGLVKLDSSGDVLYATSESSNELFVIDVSTPATPTFITAVSDASFESLQDVLVHDGMLFVTNRRTTPGEGDTVARYTIGNPANPAYADSYTAPDQAGYLTLEPYQDFVFVAAESASRIDALYVEAGSPIELVESIAGDSSLQGVSALEISGDYLYAVARDAQSLNTYALALDGIPPVDPPEETGTENPETPSESSEEATTTPGAPNAGVQAMNANNLLPVNMLVLALGGLILAGVGRFVAVRLRRS